MKSEIERYQNEILKHKEKIRQFIQAQQQEQNQIIAKIGIIEYIQNKEKEAENERNSRKHKGNKSPNSKSNNKTVPK